MLYTGPLFYEENEQPYDFYRYTQFGLRYLFTSTGFIVERLDWLEGYFGTVGYQLNCMARYLPWRPNHLNYGLIGYGLVPIMVLLKMECAAWSIIFHRLETRIKFQTRGYPKNYVVIASKAREDKGEILRQVTRLVATSNPYEAPGCQETDDL
jgi:hypothetical protein